MWYFIVYILFSILFIRYQQDAQCAEYNGNVCESYLGNTNIYVDPDANIEYQEAAMLTTKSKLGLLNLLQSF